ncbi:hypothetical protein KAR91_38300 [Candidatus Pacearchaeota archaeon]|nr:hypothetical protein [Candidatus Pacearchaeota archaeon]
MKQLSVLVLAALICGFTVGYLYHDSKYGYAVEDLKRYRKAYRYQIRGNSKISQNSRTLDGGKTWYLTDDKWKILLCPDIKKEINYSRGITGSFPEEIKFKETK